MNYFKFQIIFNFYSERLPNLHKFEAYLKWRGPFKYLIKLYSLHV
jgi:hypothetical protein